MSHPIRSRPVTRKTPGARPSRRATIRACSSLTALTIGALAFPGSAHAQGVAPAALPQGGQVVSGAATIATGTNAVTITQSTSSAVIDWTSFSIGAGNTVTFAQPDARSATLNLVSGSDVSTLAGSLIGTGNVALLNPNGVAITSTGVVDVGSGFIAATLALEGSDPAGKLIFRGNGHSAAVSNAGKITVGAGGFAALVGGTITNSGTITVPAGHVTLAAGEAATIDTFGDGFLQIAVGQPGAYPSQQPSLLSLSGNAARTAWRNVVNLPPSLAATSATRDGQALVLGTAPASTTKASVDVTGSIDVSSRAAAGGRSRWPGRTSP